MVTSAASCHSSSVFECRRWVISSTLIKEESSANWFEWKRPIPCVSKLWYMWGIMALSLLSLSRQPRKRLTLSLYAWAEFSPPCPDPFIFLSVVRVYVSLDMLNLVPILWLELQITAHRSFVPHLCIPSRCEVRRCPFADIMSNAAVASRSLRVMVRYLWCMQSAIIVFESPIRTVSRPLL